MAHHVPGVELYKQAFYGNGRIIMSVVVRIYTIFAIFFAALTSAQAQMSDRPEGAEPPSLTAPQVRPQPKIAVLDTAFYNYNYSVSTGFATYLGGVYIGPVFKVSAMPLLISLGCRYLKTNLRSNLSYDDQYDCSPYGGTLFVNYRVTDLVVPSVYFYYLTP